MFHMASDCHISSVASSLLHSGWEADITLVSKTRIINNIITVITIIQGVFKKVAYRILAPMLGE